jgi:hypothetical protein
MAGAGRCRTLRSRSGRTCKRQWTVPLPAVQQALPQCPRAPAAGAGVHSAGRLRVAGVRRPRPRSHSWTADLCRLRRPGPQPRSVRGTGHRGSVRWTSGSAAKCWPDGRSPPRTRPQPPEQGRDMAVAGGRPSMHARRRQQWTPTAADGAHGGSGTSTRAAVQTRVSAARRAAAACRHGGSVRGASGTAAAWRWCPDGWCPPRTPPPAGWLLLQEAVAGQVAAGQVPLPPVGAGELSCSRSPSWPRT